MADDLHTAEFAGQYAFGVIKKKFGVHWRVLHFDFSSHVLNEVDDGAVVSALPFSFVVDAYQDQNERNKRIFMVRLMLDEHMDVAYTDEYEAQSPEDALQITYLLNSIAVGDFEMFADATIIENELMAGPLKLSQELLFFGSEVYVCLYRSKLTISRGSLSLYPLYVLTLTDASFHISPDDLDVGFSVRHYGERVFHFECSHKDEVESWKYAFDMATTYTLPKELAVDPSDVEARTTMNMMNLVAAASDWHRISRGQFQGVGSEIPVDMRQTDDLIALRLRGISFPCAAERLCEMLSELENVGEWSESFESGQVLMGIDDHTRIVHQVMGTALSRRYDQCTLQWKIMTDDDAYMLLSVSTEFKTLGHLPACFRRVFPPSAFTIRPVTDTTCELSYVALHTRSHSTWYDAGISAPVLLSMETRALAWSIATLRNLLS